MHSDPRIRHQMATCDCENPCGIDDEGSYCRIIGDIDTKGFKTFNKKEKRLSDKIYKMRQEIQRCINQENLIPINVEYDAILYFHTLYKDKIKKLPKEDSYYG